MTTTVCEECNAAEAVTTRVFNGRTRVALCRGCAAFWDKHDLDTEDPS